jgi:hypothetical protein
MDIEQALFDVCRERGVRLRDFFRGRSDACCMSRAKVLQVLRGQGLTTAELSDLSHMTQDGVRKALVK